MANNQDGPEDTGAFLCVECQTEVADSEALHQDGRCVACHNAPAVIGRGLRCTCGIEIAKASMCTEADCPYRR